MILPPNIVRTPMLAIEARREVERMREAASEVHRQIRGERRGGVGDRAQLVAAVAAAEADALAIDTTTAELRALARRRKDEISEWKHWYSQQSVTGEAPAALDRLNHEIAWRAAEIAEAEAGIQTGLAEQAVADGVAAQLAGTLAAYDAGAFDHPMADDPRWQAIDRAVEAAEAQLDHIVTGTGTATISPMRDRRGDRRGDRPGPKAVFEVKLTRRGRLYFNLKAPNGRVLVTSGRHEEPDGVLAALNAVRAVARSGAVAEARIARSGEHYFSIVGADGTALARSEMYSSRRAMQNGIASVERNAPVAHLRDLT